MFIGINTAVCIVYLVIDFNLITLLAVLFFSFVFYKALRLWKKENSIK